MKLIGSILKNACPECGSDLILRESKKYKRIFWGCITFPKCDSGHGAHQYGELRGEPLGIPANKETKQWRMKAHAIFDKLWKDKLMSRKDAYKHLQLIMNIPKDIAHISMFNIDLCKKLIEVLSK